MIQTTGWRRFVALMTAISMACGPATGLCQPRDDKQEKAPPKPTGKPNTLVKVSENADEVVYNIKICKGKSYEHKIKVNGIPREGTFANPQAKNLKGTSRPSRQMAERGK